MPGLAARVSCLSVCKRGATPCQPLSHARSTSQGKALCLLHKSLEQLTAFSFSVPALPSTLEQLLAEVKAGNAPVSFGASASWAPSQGTTAVDACCPFLSPAICGAPAFSVGSRQHKSGFIWPVGHHRNRKFPAAPQDSPNLEMVQGELNPDMITGIWPEISSSAQEIVCCLCLNVFVCLCLKALNNVIKLLAHPTLQNR